MLVNLALLNLMVVYLERADIEAPSLLLRIQSYGPNWAAWVVTYHPDSRTTLGKEVGRKREFLSALIEGKLRGAAERITLCLQLLAMLSLPTPPWTSVSNPVPCGYARW